MITTLLWWLLACLLIPIALLALKGLVPLLYFTLRHPLIALTIGALLVLAWFWWMATW
jgi:hypothetical protein